MNDNIYPVNKPLLGMWEVSVSEAGIAPHPQLPLCSPPSSLLTPLPPSAPVRLDPCVVLHVGGTLAPDPSSLQA